MNYKEYNAFKENYLKDNDPYRADCMNPFKSMDYLIDIPDDENLKEMYSSVDISQEKLYSVWSKNIDTESLLPSIENNLVFSSGVRSSLFSIFSIFPKKEIHLPLDIYPKYLDIATDAGAKFKLFPTSENIPWEYLNNLKESIILLTFPLSTKGEVLNARNLSYLKTLLSSGNIVVIDAVYDYDILNTLKKLAPLLQKDNLFFLHSLSKSYLCPEVLGINFIPQKYHDLFKKNILPGLYDMFEIKKYRSYFILETYENLPEIQEKEFRSGLIELLQVLKKKGISLKISPFHNGYFRTVGTPFQRLLDYGIMGIPSSVFGGEDNTAVVTGLYYLGDN